MCEELSEAEARAPETYQQRYEQVVRAYEESEASCQVQHTENRVKLTDLEGRAQALHAELQDARDEHREADVLRSELITAQTQAVKSEKLTCTLRSDLAHFKKWATAESELSQDEQMETARLGSRLESVELQLNACRLSDAERAEGSSMHNVDAGMASERQASLEEAVAHLRNTVAVKDQHLAQWFNAHGEKEQRVNSLEALLDEGKAQLHRNEELAEHVRQALQRELGEVRATSAQDAVMASESQAKSEENIGELRRALDENARALSEMSSVHGERVQTLEATLVECNAQLHAKGDAASAELQDLRVTLECTKTELAHATRQLTECEASGQALQVQLEQVKAKAEQDLRAAEQCIDELHGAADERDREKDECVKTLGAQLVECQARLGRKEELEQTTNAELQQLHATLERTKAVLAEKAQQFADREVQLEEVRAKAAQDSVMASESQAKSEESLGLASERQASLEKAVADLRNTVAEKDQHLAQWFNAHGEKEQRVNSLEALLDEGKAQLHRNEELAEHVRQALQRELGEVRATSAQDAVMASESQAKLEEYIGELRRALDENARALSEMSSVRERVQTLEATLVECNTRLRGKEELEHTANAELQQLRATLECTKTELMHATQRLAECEASQRQLDENSGRMASECQEKLIKHIAELRQKIDEKDDAISQWSSAYGKIDQCVTRTKQELAEREVSLTQIGATCQALEAQIKEARALRIQDTELAAARETRDQACITDLHRKVAEKERQSAAQAAALQQLQQQQQQQQQQQGGLQSRCSEAERLAVELRAACVRSELEVSTFTRLYNEKDILVTAVEVTLADCQRKIHLWSAMMMKLCPACRAELPLDLRGS
eukprot:NODE_832_length_2742_cov_8.548375.p1 GENE.NODE_832_length_2742_cov_8.548375~~NODE_832_length_2742_cov_8.548375.p1  ORF type:complete len:853 (+),score=252.67 NODE_832_length_2742_cov_8.548375:97-2655(+)